jgi:tryptophanyl-tRNA synthetase
MKQTARKVILSGIQPTGIPHLGNYLGALREWSALSKAPEPNTRQFYSLMDLHAMTITRPAEELRKDVFDGACTLLACGIEPKANKCSLFIQSNVKQHLELFWILQCLTKISELQRMTQFKDKTARKLDSDMGLLT